MLENMSSGFANNTGADQTVHLRSLVGTFVIHYPGKIVVFSRCDPYIVLNTSFPISLREIFVHSSY